MLKLILDDDLRVSFHNLIYLVIMAHCAWETFNVIFYGNYCHALNFSLDSITLAILLYSYRVLWLNNFEDMQCPAQVVS